MLDDVQLLGQIALRPSLLANQHAEKPNRYAPQYEHEHPPKDGSEGQEIGQQQGHATKVRPTCRLSFPEGHVRTGEFCIFKHAIFTLATHPHDTFWPLHVPRVRLGLDLGCPGGPCWLELDP